MSAVAVRFHDQHPGEASLREAVADGLSRTPKAIAPKFFYDQTGSELFDAICETPEYYLTRTEIGILRDNAEAIAELVGSGVLLIELGSGASKKVRLLLDALKPTGYVGVDISRDFLLDSTRRLARDYPWLEVHATCADFSDGLALPHCDADSKPLAFYPGSSIGNFTPDEAVQFLRSVREVIGEHGGLLIGVDLKKDPAILNAAYNDAQGVTAAFNLNLLTRIRTELGARLDPDGFAHRAHFNSEAGRMEMHLLSLKDQNIELDGTRYPLARGETIHTECSYKYTIEEFHALAERAGLRGEAVWTDGQHLFSVHYLVAERGVDADAD